eukprot:1156845-Pelagomonas_calceolata.AAC.5
MREREEKAHVYVCARVCARMCGQWLLSFKDIPYTRQFLKLKQQQRNALKAVPSGVASTICQQASSQKTVCEWRPSASMAGHPLPGTQHSPCTCRLPLWLYSQHAHTFAVGVKEAGRFFHRWKVQVSNKSGDLLIWARSLSAFHGANISSSFLASPYGRDLSEGG